MGPVYHVSLVDQFVQILDCTVVPSFNIVICHQSVPVLNLFSVRPSPRWVPTYIFFYSFYPSQSKIGPSLLYPFILSIRTSPRWVSVNYILLFISSVPVQVGFQFIVFFILVLHSSPSFVPVYDIILFLHLSQSKELVPVYHIHYPINSSQSKVGSSLSYPLSYQFFPVQGLPLLIISIILSIRPSPRLALVYHIHYPIHSSQSKVGPCLSYPLSYLFVPVQGWL